jgi:hypothetical protein
VRVSPSFAEAETAAAKIVAETMALRFISRFNCRIARPSRGHLTTLSSNLQTRISVAPSHHLEAPPAHGVRGGWLVAKMTIVSLMECIAKQGH